MKSLHILKRAFVALALFAAVCCAHAEEHYTEGFADIKWATSPEETKGAMLARAGVTLLGEQSTPNFLVFTGGSYAGESVTRWEFTFDANRLWKASALLQKVNIESQYTKLQELFSHKYGHEGHREKGTRIHRATYWLNRNLWVDIDQQGVLAAAQNPSILRESSSAKGL
ncbi:MAG TPA: hypothetical protein VF593_03875 [Chthoniobacteraceae bacterium]|jgi:hypothetical protein